MSSQTPLNEITQRSSMTCPQRPSHPSSLRLQLVTHPLGAVLTLSRHTILSHWMKPAETRHCNRSRWCKPPERTCRTFHSCRHHFPLSMPIASAIKYFRGLLDLDKRHQHSLQS